MEKRENLNALFILINAGHAAEIVELARSAGAAGATILSARGEGKHHEMFMGITLDTEKEIIVSIVDKLTAGKVMEVIKEKAGVNTPAHGVCFTMPIDKAVGLESTVSPE